MPARSRSSALPLLGLAGTLLLLCGIVFGVRSRPPRTPTPEAAAPKAARVIVAAAPTLDPAPDADPEPAAPPAPVVDEAAVARAREALEAAKRERVSTLATLADVEKRFRSAAIKATGDAAAARTLAVRVKDPSVRIEQAANRSSRARWEAAKIKSEADALAAAPRAKAKPLFEQTAVARAVEGKEYHFEVRRNRVAYIDVERLINLVKNDAKLQLKLSGRGRSVSGEVGPVGEFSMGYEMGATVPDALSEMLDASASLEFRSWEIVPARDDRGEPYAVAVQPGSAFSRAIRKLTPSRSAITFWVYPDGFELYRKLRDDLHDRGFLVAARPLPEGIAVRGSPGGSVSAGQ